MRLVTDTIEFGTRELPRWNTVSISGYHIREAGSTAVQELAFTIADGMAYVEAALARGLRIDDFAPRLSFFFNSHSDFFEEIAKFRASRRIWHRLMTERYGAENERSAWMRFHTQTAGVSLTPQQPLNNLTRVALQALAAVLGGTQSLHTDAYDEALAVPTAEAALLALRQQQIIAEESGVDATVDPLGGSWFVEALTERDRGRASCAISTRSTGAAGWSPRSPRATRSARSPTRRIDTSASSTPASGGSSGSTPTSTRRRRRGSRSWPCRPARSNATWRVSSGHAAGPRRRRRGGRPRRPARRGIPPGIERDEPDAPLPALRRGVRDARRAMRRPARGVRGVPRAGRRLSGSIRSDGRRARPRRRRRASRAAPRGGGRKRRDHEREQPADSSDRPPIAPRRAARTEPFAPDLLALGGVGGPPAPDAARVDRERGDDRDQRAEDLRPDPGQPVADGLEADRPEAERDRPTRTRRSVR